MRKYLLYYYTNDFLIRKYTHIYAVNLDKAWREAEQKYGKGCLETMVEESRF